MATNDRNPEDSVSTAPREGTADPTVVPRQVVGGIEVFRDRLLDAACNEIEGLYPEFVTKLRELRASGTGIELMMNVPAPADAERRFGKYRSLLGLVFDIELGIHQLRTALRLMRLRLSPEVLAALGMTAAEWFYYHEGAWGVSLYALIDRVDALVTKALRDLRRPYDKQGWELARKPLARVLAAMRVEAGTVRHETAHGVYASGGTGSVLGIAEQGLWEHLATLKLWVPPEYTLEHVGGPDDWARWHQRAFTASRRALATLLTIMQKLTDEIDWERVKGNQAAGQAAKPNNSA